MPVATPSRDGGPDVSRPARLRRARTPRCSRLRASSASPGAAASSTLPADHQHLEVAGRGDDPVRGGEPEASRSAPPRRWRPTTIARDVARARVGEDLLGDIAAAERDRRRRRAARRAAGCAGCGRARRPAAAAAAASRRRPRSSRPAAARPSARAARTRRSAFAPGPTQTRIRSATGHGASIAWSRRYSRIWRSTRSAVRRSASSRSAIRLPLRKKFRTARRGRLGHVDLALAQALEQLVGRQVDELDLVRLVEHAVGHRLADARRR